MNEEILALGTVVDTDRGALPFSLVHGEPLIAAAMWALEAAGVMAVDSVASWEAIQETGEAFVVHDSLCPMTPPTFLAHCAETALERGAVVVGVRPVTDTVKTVVDGAIDATLDRTTLLSVASPIVLPAEVVAALDGLPAGDFAELAQALAQRFPVVTLEAPAEGRRVGSADDVRLVEALTARP